MALYNLCNSSFPALLLLISMACKRARSPGPQTKVMGFYRLSWTDNVVNTVVAEAVGLTKVYRLTDYLKQR